MLGRPGIQDRPDCKPRHLKGSLRYPNLGLSRIPGRYNGMAAPRLPHLDADSSEWSIDRPGSRPLSVTAYHESEKAPIQTGTAREVFTRCRPTGWKIVLQPARLVADRSFGRVTLMWLIGGLTTLGALSLASLVRSSARTGPRLNLSRPRSAKFESQRSSCRTVWFVSRRRWANNCSGANDRAECRAWPDRRWT